LLWEAERKCPMQVPYYKILRLKKIPFEQRELIFTVSEIAKIESSSDNLPPMAVRSFVWEGAI